MSRRQMAGGSVGHNAWRPVDRPEPVLACGQPRKTTDLRHGPHNRCTHGTAAPPHRRFCRGDNACAFRLPAGVDLCPEHAREARMTITDIRRETATSMGLSTDELSRMEFGHQTGARAA